MTNSFYFSDLIGVAVNPEFSEAALRIKEALEADSYSVNPSDNYKCVGKRYQTDKTIGREFVDKLSAQIAARNTEKFLAPVSIFHNEIVEYDNKPLGGTSKWKQFHVSLGIFDLDTTSATATITKNNKLELTWTERAGKGKFNTLIPSYLVATSAPTLSYKGGVFDIRVNVESRSKNDTLFVGRLVVEKEQTNESKGGSYNYQKPERVCGKRVD